MNSSSKMRQTRSRNITTTANSPPNYKTPHVSFSSIHRLRSGKSSAMSDSRPVYRRKAVYIQQQSAIAAALAQDTTHRTEHPIPMNCTVDSVIGVVDPLSSTGSASAESCIQAAPDLIKEVSAGPIVEDSGLVDLDLSGTSLTDSVIEDAAQGPAEASADLTDKDRNLASQALSDCAELDDVQGGLAEGMIWASAHSANNYSDLASGHNSGSALVPGSSEDLIEIEDSNEIGFNYNYARAFLSDHDLLDLFEESNSSDDSIDGYISNSSECRTLPNHRGRDHGHLQ